MARLKIALSKQIITLMSVAALVQLGIVGGLAYIHTESERIAQKTDQAIHTADAISRLVDNLHSIVSDTDAAKLLITSGVISFGSQPVKIYEQFTQLKSLLKDKPQELAIVTTSERSSLQAMAIIQQLKDMRDNGEIFNRLERRPLVSQLLQLRQKIVSPDLLALADAERNIAERGPARQEKLRLHNRNLLIADGLATVAIFLLLTIFLLRNVAFRLNRAIENTERLLLDANHFMPTAQAEEQEDGDEISRLNNRLQQMGKTINQIASKQVAAVDNANDMICSLTEEGVISSSNSAAGKLMGCHPSELIGKNFRAIVHRSDANTLSTHLQNTRSNGGQASQKTVEVRLVNRARRSVPVLWSTQWNAEDNQYFAVAHDISQLKAAYSMKEEVLAIIANDLHGPIVNLQAFLDLLEEGSIARVEERGRRHINSARRQTNQMLMLINDMIDLEKAKGGLLQLQAETLNLDKVIDQAQMVIGPFAEEKGIVLDCRRSGLNVRGEEDKLLRILTNLLGNAVQHAPADSSVLLVTKCEGGQAQVSISDKGQGLLPEKVRTLFQAFNPSETSTALSAVGASANANPASSSTSLGGDASDTAGGAANGSSLALAMCKAFVELQGGKISAVSKPGEGTTITFTIPLSV
jgi:PAS domain S-box-containing protein